MFERVLLYAATLCLLVSMRCFILTCSFHLRERELAGEVQVCRKLFLKSQFFFSVSKDFTWLSFRVTFKRDSDAFNTE